MAFAWMSGIGSGVLHAVTGPDHVLSLTPLVIAQPDRSWRVGLSWGIGHGLGTLVVSGVLLVLTSGVELAAVSEAGERMAGAALLVLGALSFRKARAQAHAGRGALVVGVLHGVTGAAALLVTLPLILAKPVLVQAVFLTAFALGSAVAMGVMTSVIARVAEGTGRPAVLVALRTGAAVLSLGLGAFWLCR